MSGVLGAADKHIDVRRFLEEHSCRKGSAVLFIAPLLEAVVVLEVVFSILEYAVDGDDALGNEIDALDLRGRRYLRVGGDVVHLHGLVQVLGGNRRRRSAADDVLARLCKEQSHHSVIVVTALGRTYRNVHRLALPDLYDADGGVVKGLAAVESTRFVEDDRGERLCGEAGIPKRCNVGYKPVTVV